jgi:hypothetical protein
MFYSRWVQGPDVIRNLKLFSGNSSIFFAQLALDKGFRSLKSLSSLMSSIGFKTLEKVRGLISYV